MASSIFIVVCGLLHVGFLILEMYFWDKPLGRKVFRLSPAQARETKVLAANQGLYNGILAAGLAWSVFSGVGAQIFFLSAVSVAGIFGALTVSRRIFWVQALPALLGLLFLSLGL